MSEEIKNIDSGRTTLVKGKYQGRCLFWTLAFLFVLILFILRFMGCLGYQHVSQWESRVKSTLKSIGSSHLAYTQRFKTENYGSFDALKDTNYIAEGYTLGNMIENYSMQWDVMNLSTVNDEGIVISEIHTFTVIAYPRDTRPGVLSTFAITEDQLVRVFDPGRGVNWESVKTWDPIL